MKKFILLVFFIALSAAAFAAYDAHQFLHSPLNDKSQTFELEVKRGQTVRTIASNLATAGLLQRPIWWEFYARYTGLARSIKTGEYTVSTAVSPIALLDELQLGRQKQYAFTILEGWNIWQLREALATDPILIQTLQNVDDADLLESIGATRGHPEGQFLPDTYLFPRGTTDAEFLLRAHNALVVKLDEVWQARQDNLPVTTAYEVLTLASIIEKETSVAAERQMVSGVIAGRLRKGMRLQMDPTVIYGIGKSFNGNITRRDLKTATPYNTYTIAGLPPTPIAMSGAESLEAAVNPAATKALFFVADGTGGHVFNETVEEHNKAVRKYILKK